MIFHSQLFLESHNPAMFQSPPTRNVWRIGIPSSWIPSSSHFMQFLPRCWTHCISSCTCHDFVTDLTRDLTIENKWFASCDVGKGSRISPYIYDILWLKDLEKTTTLLWTNTLKTDNPLVLSCVIYRRFLARYLSNLTTRHLNGCLEILTLWRWFTMENIALFHGYVGFPEGNWYGLYNSDWWLNAFKCPWTIWKSMWTWSTES